MDRPLSLEIHRLISKKWEKVNLQSSIVMKEWKKWEKMRLKKWVKKSIQNKKMSQRSRRNLRAQSNLHRLKRKEKQLLN